MPYSPIGQLQAQDPDFGPGGSVVYRLGRPDPLLVVNAATGELSLREVPLSPSDPRWPSRPRWLPLVAADHGEPPRSRTAMVLLNYGYRDDGVNQEQIWKDQVIYFEKEHYKVTIQENTSPGTVVLAVKAVGSARAMERRVVYGLTSVSDTFTIDTRTGQIEVRSSLELDYEKRRHFDLLVSAETKGSKHGEKVEAFSLLTMYVTEVNDSPPSFILPVFTASISEDLLPGTHVTQVSAVDPDRGTGGDVEYKLLDDQGIPFKLDSQSGILTTNGLLDREIQAYYSLQVIALDKGWPQHTSSAIINISISDVNDNLPILQPVDPLVVFEDLSPGSIVTRLSASDVDLWPPLMFSLDGEEGENSSPIFMVEPWDGTLVLLAPLVNRSSTLELTLRVSDEDHEVTTQLIITIRKKKHYSPRFSQSVYKASVSESSLPGTMVLMVTAADKDLRENGKLSYRLLHQSSSGFSVDASTGQVLTTSYLHYNSDNPEVLLVLEAGDEEKPPHTAVAILMVTVRPKSGLGLQFNQNSYSVSASKSLTAGAQLATVSLTSSAIGSTDFFVAGQGQLANAFMLVRRARAPHEAQLVATREVNFEEVHGSDTLTLIACNRNDPVVNGTAKLMLHIQSTKKAEVNFKDIVLKVHIEKTLELGEEILQLSANGPAGFTYQIVAGNKDAIFQLNRKTGALSLKKRLDHVTQNEYELLVSVKPPGQQVWSKGGPIGLSLARVLVVKANELSHTPSFAAPQFHVGVREGFPPTPLLVLQAGDADQGLSYSLREEPGQRGGLEKLALNPTTGQVSTREPLDFETQRRYMVRVQAHTSHGLQAETSLSVWVHGQDEFEPVFTQTEYHFAVPEGARAGQIVGQVSARDRDAGLDGLVHYTLPDGPTFLLIDQYSGELHLAVDAGKAPHPGPRVILVSILAAGSRTGARTSLARVRLDLTATGLGLGSRPGTGLLGPILAGFLVAAGLMLLGGLIAAVAVCMRHKRPLTPTASKSISKSEPALSICDGSGNPYEYSPPGYAAETDWEDAEIRMITESRRSGDGPGRVPDSGIQQDEDQLSETSGHSDKVDLVVDPVFGGSSHSPTSSPNRVSAFVQVQASVGGGKTAGLMIEDWEKLLDWGPQFKTLAGVLFEISGLWDERLGLPVPADHPGAPRTRIMPPPLLTSVAQPGARCVPPRPLYTRTNLLPMPAPPASPFVHSSSPPDVARQVPMTPRLSPAMSPLPSHSPPASPRPLGLLPCAPNLGAMQEHPELCI
uniref:protocadherin-16-like n=1 Tax=Myxine glutinosa TaxID=7769 RepID=UPI00358FBD7D